MAKLTREQKIELYKKRKQGETVSSLSKEYQIRSDNIKYLVRLIDRHGFDILRSNKNNYYSPELKLEIINKVLIDGKLMLVYYNTQRITAKLKGITPVQYRNQSLLTA
ncbi:IS3 family transposase [Thomasclavelia spiroformis]|uniref:IS3 family transposase n=1 Tax=Thomasclavelia spiroformis TaxID=29348 RepID=UPI003993A4BD